MKNHHESCRKGSDNEKMQKLRRKAKAKENDEEIDCRRGFSSSTRRKSALRE
jgi:hypothetical protein